MPKFLETRKPKFENGRFKGVEVKKMKLTDAANPKLNGRGRGYREVYENKGPETIPKGKQR